MITAGPGETLTDLSAHSFSPRRSARRRVGGDREGGGPGRHPRHVGDDACQYEFGIQHLTTAYAYAEADSDAAQRLLRRVRPSHAPPHINAVHLVDVTADPQAKTITWERVTRVPLGPVL
ncbi:hypothetical protein [Streptomyces sp. SJL17-1]|uniref:hypothetical protein n=1 Tax=Streptomyces sp. SJL17-1 TaxID=2967223 RepID=UPI002966BE52|nr:hypothetical protein [Streptomyces sp. SJL17-1]